MNKDQMEMLSVKNAIERTVQSQITAMLSRTYAAADVSKYFFEYVERYVAGLFVSGQINNDYQVRSDINGDLVVAFSTCGQKVDTTFMLPNFLRWTKNTSVQNVKPLTQPAWSDFAKPPETAQKLSQNWSNQLLIDTITQMLLTSVDSVMALGFGNTRETREALERVCREDLTLLVELGHIRDFVVAMEDAVFHIDDIVFNVAIKCEGFAWFDIPITAHIDIRPEITRQETGNTCVNLSDAYDKAMKGM